MTELPYFVGGLVLGSLGTTFVLSLCRAAERGDHQNAQVATYMRGVRHGRAQALGLDVEQVDAELGERAESWGPRS
ncbi:MAG: hypothetical protein ABL993_02425 [Vicinamibacterales bacterium]